MNNEMTIILKVLFVIALTGAVLGAWSERHEELSDMVLHGLFWLLAAPGLVVFVGGILCGIAWLFM